MIYFDNAATSWPKPPEVLNAMTLFLQEAGANPGRAGHRLAVEAGRTVYGAREAVRALFNAESPLRVVFTLNVTAALNLALHGLLGPGDHVLTSSMEHNSVMRPLRALEKKGVALTVIPCFPSGGLDPERFERGVTSATRLGVLTHASNVTGTLMPIAEIGRRLRRRGVLLLVDAAQTAGSRPIDMHADLIDILAFTGHKGLLGPTGTGGLVLGERVDPGRMTPLMQGGTGSDSEHELQPNFLPDMLEPGTVNAAGLAGLAAGIRFISRHGVEAVQTHEERLTRRLLQGLLDLPGVTVHGEKEASRMTGAVSFSIEGMSSAEAGQRLDEKFEILCRTGLHCAPAAHKTIGTFPGGTVRFGLGFHNTTAEVDEAVRAVLMLSGTRP